MIKYLLYIGIFLSFIQLLQSQEDGVVALSLPFRNSLKFNKYTINPTFSFVREQNKYISFSNKRQWVQFDDAPQTYLFSYSGRFEENRGMGIGLFQQNYGVLTTFGGILNYAYNLTLDRDNNLTFGLNLGAYKSGVNEANVITNYPDPSLQNIPSNTLIIISPGINYGTVFFDFGVSLNNIAAYNFTTSKLIEENPEQSVQAHIMYTGYVNSHGFFDESKFTGFVRSEFKKDQTVFSGIMMFTVPKGLWAQAGYNTLYGVSAGIGLNISSQISLEYNYEKEIGDLTSFGNSHEITLAFKFKNNYRYNYSGDDEESAMILPSKRVKPAVARPSNNAKVQIDRKAIVEAKAEAARIKLAEKAQIKAEKDAKIKLEQEAKIKAEQEAKAKAEETRIKLEQEAQIKAKQEAKAKEEEAARIKLAEEAKAKAAQEARIKLEQEAQIKAEQEAKAKEKEAVRLKLAEEAKAKAAEEARIKLEQEAQIKAEQEAKEKEEEAARIKLAEEVKAKAAEEERIKLEQEAKAKEDEEARIRQEQLDEMTITAKGDATAKAMEEITKLTVDSNIEQQELLVKLREAVSNKEKDLKDLKEENDLSEQGIYREPKPFKSVSAENAALESLNMEIDNIINDQNGKIAQLESLYSIRLINVTDKNDTLSAYYLKAIQDLKAEQLQAIQTKDNLLATLEEIKVATEIERKRRIKRAAYDNEQDRYEQDRLQMNSIRQNTPLSSVPLKESDFNFGEEQPSNIQILKDVNNIESGYYLVIAVHSDIEKRNDFLTKAVASGQSDVDFFYDVNTSKYYIYYKKFENIDEARRAMQSKGSEPYNANMSMFKIENQ